MIRVKMCGLTREEDIIAANEVRPDYIGFVFWEKSRRYISPERAAILKGMLHKDIAAVGVFIDEDIDVVSRLLQNGTIDIAQLHGSEDDEYITQLRARTGKPVIRAFRIKTPEDIKAAQKSPADMVLLDAGAGDGVTFDWSLLKGMNRPYFLAGGLDSGNIYRVKSYPNLFALDVSSGIETDGHKDINKMAAFMKAAGKEERL